MDESKRLQLERSYQRHLAKVNYRIHTYAIRENLLHKVLSKAQMNFVYANEAELLNVALFGITANQWRDAIPTPKGNIRDEAIIVQLVVLSNLDSINSVFIKQGLEQPERLRQLN